MAQRKKEIKLRSKASSGNIYADLGYPNPKEANVKFDLALLIGSIIKRRRLTQAKAAQIMNIDQPKVSKIVRGILSDFTIERLMNFLVSLGCDIEIKASFKKAAPSIHVSKAANRLRA